MLGTLSTDDILKLTPLIFAACLGLGLGLRRPAHRRGGGGLVTILVLAGVAVVAYVAVTQLAPALDALEASFDPTPPPGPVVPE